MSCLILGMWAVVFWLRWLCVQSPGDLGKSQRSAGEERHVGLFDPVFLWHCKSPRSVLSHMPKPSRGDPSTGAWCSPHFTPEIRVTILHFALAEGVRGRRETLNFSPWRKFGAARCLPYSLFTPAGLSLRQAALQDHWRGTFLTLDTPFPGTDRGECFPDTLVAAIITQTSQKGFFVFKMDLAAWEVLDVSASYKERNEES